MKVICIDGTTDPDSPLPVDVIFGEVYTVTDEVIDDGELWYSLAERDTIYTANGFAPLSDIDEKEFQREIFQPVDQRDLIWH